VGEVMVLIGAFQAARSDSWLMQMTGGRAYGQIITIAVIACFGVILTAGYMLWTIQRVFLGPEKAEYKGFAEVDQREVAVLTPLTVMAIGLGVLPWLMFFVFTKQTVDALFKVFGVS
jgi:NADH-quinone oxidoreductase subunit M